MGSIGSINLDVAWKLNSLRRGISASASASASGDGVALLFGGMWQDWRILLKMSRIQELEEFRRKTQSALKTKYRYTIATGTGSDTATGTGTDTNSSS